jgi:AraC-like DNA-binding protein
MKPVMIIGNGGHASVVTDVIKSLNNYYIKGYLDDVQKEYIRSDGLINFIRLGNYYREHNLEASNPLINNVLIYINEHYKENLTLATIAEKFYVNSSYLSRVFSETMNISLIKYIRKVKIYRLAVEILSSNNHKDIWKSYGYKSYSTYLKNFQRVFSISPEAFIDNHKGTTAKNIGFPSELYSYLKNLAKHFSNN